MGRAPCCDKANVKKGPWSPEEDEKLKEYIEKHGTGGNWIALPQKADLKRCGKSCRLRWLNYLRPDIKHGEFSDDEDRIICSLYASIGSRWSIIATQLPGRTDNDIKNYWNTKLKKKLFKDHRKTTPTTYPSNISLLQTSSPSSSSVLSPSPSSSAAAAYKSRNNTNYYITTTQTSPLTGCEPISISSSLLQSQQGYMGNSLNPYQVKDSSALMFGGGGEASCSSSDGSYNNQISGSHIRSETDRDYRSYFCNGFDENQELMISGGSNLNGFAAEKPIGFYGETTDPVDYYSSLEEIKQLICTDNVCNNLGSVAENKTQEKVLYY